ncbi:MAG: hypothetical protein FWH33_00335 [Oscillospiraceae bacterium]|nr:hypothetical protein [Oscillospiraceae bacterium]
MSNILNFFDGDDIGEISALIDKLEKSSFDYLKLERDGVCIVIGKNGAGDAGAGNVEIAGSMGVSNAASAVSAGGRVAGRVAGGVAGSHNAAEMGASVSIGNIGAPGTSGISGNLETHGTSEPPGISGTPETPGTPVNGEIVEQDGYVIVRSPNYGLFYTQSEPGAPPYTHVGAMIKAGDTVGLLETMKTFTAISSPTDGEVSAIYVVNEETLEPGQPLMSIQI